MTAPGPCYAGGMDPFDELRTIPLSEPGSTTRSAIRQEGWRMQAYCECGGEWRCHASVLGTTPADTRSLHKCATCGAKAVFQESYPETRVARTTVGMGESLGTPEELALIRSRLPEC